MPDSVQPFAEFVRNADPLVSCVVPVYNKAQYLAESIQSLLSQEYGNLEIVIVDDASTDNSLEVAKQLAAQHSQRRIRIIQKKNGGPSDARNTGLKEAHGRVALCLDGDDIAQPSFVRKAIAAIRQNGSNLVCSDVELFGSETGSWEPEPFDPYYIRYNNSIPTLCVFDRELWVKTGGYKVAIPFAEDWEFFINCSRHDLAVTKIPEKLFRYRRTDSGLLTNYLKDKWNEPVSLMMLANTDLYNVQDLEFAQVSILKAGTEWRDRFMKQDALHPGEWLLKFLLGIYEEQWGTPQRALELYAQSAQLSQLKNWLPLLRIGRIVESQGNAKAAFDLYHQIRVLRPDMHFIIGEKANQRGKAAS